MRTWNELGRRVKRGEKGIAILAPMIGKSRKKREQSEAEDNDSNKSTALLGFRKVFVWDISQTDGEPLPTLGATTGEVGTYLDHLRGYVTAQGITLEYDETIAPALGTAAGTTIRILPGQTDAETFTTLVHELSHLILKHQDRRTATTKTVRETEAEAVAFVVSKAIGLHPDSVSYIQLYHGNAALLMESLESVQRTSAVILSAIKTDESVSQDVSESAREVAESAVEPAPETKRTRRTYNQTATTEAA